MIHFSIGDGRDTKVDLDWMVLNDALNSANILGGGPLDPIKIDNFLRWSVSDGQGNWNPPSKLAEITSGKTLSMKLDQMSMLSHNWFLDHCKTIPEALKMVLVNS